MNTKYLNNTPISIGSIILALAAMGNLLSSMIPYSREICLILGIPLLLTTIFKLIYLPKTLIKDFNNPLLASIISTFSMAFMLWSMFLIPYLGYKICLMYWFISIIMHCGFVGNYILKFVHKLDVSNFTAGSFVVFAGIQMIAITAPAFHQELIGTLAFWISFIFVCFVFIVITYRYLKIKVPQQVQPIIGVYAAPFSLCLVGYLSSVKPINMIFALSLFLITKFFYVVVLLKFIEYRNYPFYPTFTGFTFPLVINATTTSQMIVHIVSNPFTKTFLTYELYLEIIIGILIITYVLIEFILNIFSREWKNSKNIS